MGASDPEFVAQGLLDHFGSLAAFAGAGVAEMREAVAAIPTLPPALVAAQSIALAGLRERALTTKFLPSDASFLNYLRVRMTKRATELLVAFFATREGCLICERTLAESAGHAVTISAAAVLRVAVGVGAAQITLAHNHPSGLAAPSKADRVATLELKERAEVLDIDLIDHLIVGGSSIYSMQRGCVL